MTLAFTEVHNLLRSAFKNTDNRLALAFAEVNHRMSLAFTETNNDKWLASATTQNNYCKIFVSYTLFRICQPKFLSVVISLVRSSLLA